MVLEGMFSSMNSSIWVIEECFLHILPSPEGIKSECFFSLMVLQIKLLWKGTEVNEKRKTAERKCVIRGKGMTKGEVVEGSEKNEI